MRVKETLTLGDWLNHHGVDSECIHVELNDDNLTLYRLVDGRTHERIETSIENVTIRRPYNDTHTDVLCFHDVHAETLMCWLRCLQHERSPAQIYVEYWDRNNSALVREAGLNRETIQFRYLTDSGRSHEIDISDVYDSKIQMFAC